MGRNLRNLDWLYFFVADVQTGFGPFIAVYLTDHKWTQAELGIALGVGSATAMLGQVPAGAFVDSLAHKRSAAFAALLAVAASAALMASSPALWPVLLAQVVYGLAACILTPLLAAITLGLVSRSAVPERLGRNARFAALGSALGAGLMGAMGTWVSSRAVFWLAATLCLPALLALRGLGAVRPDEAAALNLDEPAHEEWRHVLLDRPLLSYIACTVLFHLANAAMLPLAGVEITRRSDEGASLIIAACILVPQMTAALLSPWAGWAAQRWGRRPVLLIGFMALPLRGLLLALVGNPWLVVPVQVLDGFGGAAFGVMTPLVASDLSGPAGRFNLRMGIIGLAIGIGATISNTVAGGIASSFGSRAAFLALATAGAGAVLAVALAMPETRPPVSCQRP
ncbi:MFS transporter [Limobrevibacterium gyesilva]|uniref:MFS transporter n=1 Tax=Limobrevibacterium gyesilva TaxID=2991712 RepID=A0AA41YKX3_9PROT|nr:MFS transporter [Limobrevibacterium gyesilva]MCW3473788.1 MFS transporter [Limobrevibacterium gyesilva]